MGLAGLLIGESSHSSRSSQGSQVGIFGSIDASGGIPSWQCFLDGVLFGSPTVYLSQTTGNALCLCQSSTVVDGPHEVNVSVVTSGPIFYFDLVYYTPSPSVSLANSVIRIPRGDPSMSFVGSGWSNATHDGWWTTQVGGDQIIFVFIGEHARSAQTLY